jgi:hypothetical protein
LRVLALTYIKTNMIKIKNKQDEKTDNEYKWTVSEKNQEW